MNARTSPRTIDKVTPRPSGYWRCVFKIDDPFFHRAFGHRLRCGCVCLGGRDWLECGQFISEEMADEHGSLVAAMSADVSYLRAEWFPE